MIAAADNFTLFTRIDMERNELEKLTASSIRVRGRFALI
jgi:hypothetical protein